MSVVGGGGVPSTRGAVGGDGGGAAMQCGHPRTPAVPADGLCLRRVRQSTLAVPHAPAPVWGQPMELGGRVSRSNNLVCGAYPKRSCLRRPVGHPRDRRRCVTADCCERPIQLEALRCATGLQSLYRCHSATRPRSALSTVLNPLSCPVSCPIQSCFYSQ